MKKEQGYCFLHMRGELGHLLVSLGRSRETVLVKCLATSCFKARLRKRPYFDVWQDLNCGCREDRAKRWLGNVLSWKGEIAVGRDRLCVVYLTWVHHICVVYLICAWGHAWYFTCSWSLCASHVSYTSCMRKSYMGRQHHNNFTITWSSGCKSDAIDITLRPRGPQIRCNWCCC